jgi:hypothetical protein
MFPCAVQHTADASITLERMGDALRPYIYIQSVGVANLQAGSVASFLLQHTMSQQKLTRARVSSVKLHSKTYRFNTKQYSPHANAGAHQPVYNLTQSSHTDLFLSSAACFSCFSLSLSASLLFLSLSLMARSYSLSSSVLLGALTPNAPAISRPATAVVLSGLLAGLAAPLPLRLPSLLFIPPPAAYGILSGNWNGTPVGLAGVGGGGCGESTDFTVASGESESRSLVREERTSDGFSVSVSEPPPEESSSQDSATGADLGLLAGFWGEVVESLS